LSDVSNIKSDIHCLMCPILNQTYIVWCVQYLIRHTFSGVSNIKSDIHCLVCPILNQTYIFWCVQY